MELNMKKSLLISTLLASITLLLETPIQACTSFIIKAHDGGYVYGRTLEFGMELHSTPIAIPRNFNYQGTGVNEVLGKKWLTKYAAVGMNGINLPILIDGINEKGMSGGLLYAPNTAKYQEVSNKEASNSIASYEMLTYALTNFATVEEVKTGFQHLLINKTGHQPFNSTIPVHMTLHDAQGKSLVVEYNNGSLFIYDNPTGVMTNDPNFAYQLANIGLYANLTPQEAKPMIVDGRQFTPPSSGSGLHGLPGDFLSPSRFIRALFYSTSAPITATTAEQVAVTFHLLNNFDIPPGAVQLAASNPYGGNSDGFEKTEWVAAVDAKNLIYYVKTFTNSTVQMIDMHKLDLNNKDIKTFKLKKDELRIDLTTQ